MLMSDCCRDWWSSGDVISGNIGSGLGLSTMWTVFSLMTTASSVSWRDARDDVGTSLGFNSSSVQRWKLLAAIFTTLTVQSSLVLWRGESDCWCHSEITYYQLTVKLMVEDWEDGNAEIMADQCWWCRACSPGLFKTHHRASRVCTPLYSWAVFFFFYNWVLFCFTVI